MTQFRPCIDLHDGRVKQIVGGSLRDESACDNDASERNRTSSSTLVTNHVADQSAGWFAEKYRIDRLTGGHVIKLGPGNDAAAIEALSAYPGGMQIGGGITAENAMRWLDAGASHVIVTSWLFDASGKLKEDRLNELVRAVGTQRIVLDLSCRRVPSDSGETSWKVAMNRWQSLTEIEIMPRQLDRLARRCDEFLVHAADVEGLCQGIDEALVNRLAAWLGTSAVSRPITYAGGVATMADIEKIENVGHGAIDVTVGSSLDLFGGSGIRYQDLVRRNAEKKNAPDRD